VTAAAELVPDPDQLAHFVNATFKHADRNGFVSLRAFPDSRNKGNGKPVFIEPVPLRHPQFHDVVVERARQAAKWHEPAVFCPPIVTFRKADNARADNILEGICLSVDCDQEPVKAQTILSRLLGRPTVTVKTGGVWTAPDGRAEHKRHMHWRLCQPTRTADEHKLLQEARELAVLLVGGDGTGITPVHPLRWPGSWHRKNEPRLATIADINPDIEIDLHDALDKLRKATEHIAKAAPKPNSHANGNGSSDQLARDVADVARAMHLMPNPDLSWDEWNRRGMAIHAATAGSDEGLQIWHQWSGRSSKYDPDVTEARWQHFHRSPANRLGMGSLVHGARQADPSFTTALPDITLKVGNASNAAPHDSNETPLAPAQQPLPAIKWLNMSNWDNEPRPERDWAILNRVPLRQAGLFSGEGGTGKSIIELMKNVAHVMGRDWLCSMPEQGPAFYIGAEDDEKEIHIRLLDIIEHYGVTFEELIAGGLRVLPLLGQDATLCALMGKSGRIEVTNLYRQIYEAAGDIKPKNISIDTLSRAFAGNEIDRVQVYAFSQHMQALAKVADGSVTVLSHPSLQGISSGSGISGSTAWHGAFRFRQYLRGVKPSDGEQPDGNLREIEFKKNQYGPCDENIVLRYQRGLFLPEGGTSSLEKAAHETKADELFLNLLQRFTSQNRNVSDKPSAPTYAPTTFAEDTEARKQSIRKADFKAAMSRLFSADKIHVETYGRPSRPYTKLSIRG
jgi:RecA-family ATPase